jgi:hypothetical protein
MLQVRSQLPAGFGVVIGWLVVGAQKQNGTKAQFASSGIEIHGQNAFVKISTTMTRTSM